jgi:hypothetical protein
MALRVTTGAGRVEAIREIRFLAPLADGTAAFETAGVDRVEPAGPGVERATFRLAGPAAPQARVSCHVDRSDARRVRLTWRVGYSGPPRPFSPWVTGLRLAFADRPSGARCKAMIRWTVPDGRQSWQVPGDTPYPELDRQLRIIDFGPARLAIATSWYDPDWFHTRDLGRVGLLRLALREKPPQGAQGTVEIVPEPGERSDAELLAIAAGEPVSIEVASSGPGNLFAPGEPLRLSAQCRNLSPAARPVNWSWSVYDYDGNQISHGQRRLDLAPGEGWAEELLPGVKAAPGIYFLAGELAWPGGRRPVRTTLGVLADRVPEVRPESPFGIAGIIGNPEVYPDQPAFSTVLALCARIGVHWVRGLGFSIGPKVADDELTKARARWEAMRRWGIRPHVQCGPGVPANEVAAGAFARDFGRSLARFAFLSEYIEVGNELNYSAKPADYVARLLRPQYQAARSVAPASKVMSMGFGGVDKGWWDGFVAAGGLDSCDVISVHPGHHPRAPEFWEGWDGWVYRPQMARVLSTLKGRGLDQRREVWITEAYAPSSPERSQLDLRTAADYLVREYCLSFALGVRVIEWYQLQDGTWFSTAPDPVDGESNYGMVYTDLAPKPQYVAYGVMTAELEGARCRGRLDLGATDLYGIRFEKAGRAVDVLWSYREKHECDLAWWPPEAFKNRGRRPREPWQPQWHKPVEVALPAHGEVTATDLMGRRRRLAVRGSCVALALTGSPIYVRGLDAMRLSDRVWPEMPAISSAATADREPGGAHPAGLYENLHDSSPRPRVSAVP